MLLRLLPEGWKSYLQSFLGEALDIVSLIFLLVTGDRQPEKLVSGVESIKAVSGIEVFVARPTLGLRLACHPGEKLGIVGIFTAPLSHSAGNFTHARHSSPWKSRCNHS